MKTRIIEAWNPGPVNWGKFLLGRFDSEWSHRTAIEGGDDLPLLRTHCGWGNDHLLVLDLATGEGAVFKPGGHAAADLNRKHRIWVCPLFEPFLAWLYEQDLTDLDALPATVVLSAAPQLFGYRRQGGPKGQIILDVDPEVEGFLEALANGTALGDGSASDAARHLIHSAADGMRRPGSWERGWVEQAFGSKWQDRLEQDPEVPTHQRVRKERKP